MNFTLLKTNPRAQLSAFLVAVSTATLVSTATVAQEQIDTIARSAQTNVSALSKMSMRVRVVKVEPQQETIRVVWQRGGGGLAGDTEKGEFSSESGSAEIVVGAWTSLVPLEKVVGNSRDWQFPNFAVRPSPPEGRRRGSKKFNAGVSSTVVEFEFVEAGKVFRRFTESAPNGATASFAFPGGVLTDKGATDTHFVSQLNGLATYARLRRERLEKQFPGTATFPKQFGVIGHLGGYGEGTEIGKGGGSGYGVRHCNPAILADEARTLRLLGVNGMVGEESLVLAELGGFTNEFRKIFWGGPGSGSPMSSLMRGGRDGERDTGCPFDPVLKPRMESRVKNAIEEHKRVGARESWALWDDEIGVYVKEHMQTCPRCADAYRHYLRAEKLGPSDFGINTWEEIAPYKLFDQQKLTTNRNGQSKAGGMSDAPTNRFDALNFYYTFRFMTHATAQVYPEAAKQFKDAGIFLYAMQAPTPSWAGATFDWHEFYDGGANSAIVFETSNRDPQVWQLESYLADLSRGIAARHHMPFGCLVKPHRGAPQQRMLSVVSRGATALEWYTYGPDYAKGDSFSQKPELLDAVAQAGRFLGRAEDYLYGTKFATKPEVAFISPRSSEIWGRTGDLGITAFEDAKWVYLALRHAHIPIDVLSEQQLADGKLDEYKVAYIIGPNLRRDAAEKVKAWVRNGGSLCTDAIGLTRDEANQPATALDEMFGVKDRLLEMWGSVEPYKAINIRSFPETNRSALKATVVMEAVEFDVAVGRQPLATTTAKVLAKFRDGAGAIVENRFGKGHVTVLGFWAGLSYSAKVRRADFNMAEDFDPALRSALARPAFVKDITRPVVPASPLVEAVVLNKDGQRSVALINWAYERKPGKQETLTVKRDLEINLSGMKNVRSVRSLLHGKLPMQDETVVLPKLETIDLLVIE